MVTRDRQERKTRFLLGLGRLAIARLNGRTGPEEPDQLSRFLDSPFGVTALRRANDLMWLALQLASAAAPSAVAIPAPAATPVAGDLWQSLRATLGRGLPDMADEVANARSAGLFSLPVTIAVMDSQPVDTQAVVEWAATELGASSYPKLHEWITSQQHFEMLATLLSVLLWAECEALTEVPEISNEPLLPTRLQQALIELSRVLAHCDDLDKLTSCLGNAASSKPQLASTRQQQLPNVTDHALDGPALPMYADAQSTPCGEKKAAPLDEDVQFTVYRPRALAPMQWSRLLAFAHLSQNPAHSAPDAPTPQEQIKRQAEALLGEAMRRFDRRVEDAASGVPRQGLLTFIPEFAGIEFVPPSSSFVWLGDTHCTEFQLRASPALAGTTAKGQLRVLCGVLILAELNMSIRICHSSDEPVSDAFEAVPSVRRYRKIFASYCHDDREMVEQVSRYAQTIGDQYIADYLSLRSGETWSSALERLIREADVFQLFWSQRSMRSSFVRREWEFALNLRRAGFVRPTYWETPFPEAPELGLPPEELKALHFACIALPRAESQPLPRPVPALRTPAPTAPCTPLAAENRTGSDGGATVLVASLSAMTTASAAVLLTLRTGSLDKQSSAAETLSRAAQKVSRQPAPPARIDSNVRVSVAVGANPITAVPELDTSGLASVIFLLLGTLTIWSGRKTPRIPRQGFTKASTLNCSDGR